MKKSQYLIVGGGMTADAACRGIRELDPDGAIVLVAEEPHPPYARPPLSKALWKGKSENTIWRGTEELGVDLRLGRADRRARPRGTRSERRPGRALRYERLLLATGGRPRRLAVRRRRGHLLPHARRLPAPARARRRGGARFVVIGGGFIGSEIAAALALNGCSVTMVFPEPGIGARIFPPALSAALTTTTASRVSRFSPARQ